MKSDRILVPSNVSYFENSLSFMRMCVYSGDVTMNVFFAATSFKTLKQEHKTIRRDPAGSDVPSHVTGPDSGPER